MSLVRKFKGSSVSWQLWNLPHLEGDSEPPWLRNRSRSSLLVYVITGDGSLLASPEKKEIVSGRFFSCLNPSSLRLNLDKVATELRLLGEYY